MALIDAFSAVSNADPAEKANLLSRPYPRAIAGDPIAFGFDPVSREFHLFYEAAAETDAPTEIYLPASRHDPGGWHLESSAPETSWRFTWLEDREVLQLWAEQPGQRYSFFIRPDG